MKRYVFTLSVLMNVGSIYLILTRETIRIRELSSPTQTSFTLQVNSNPLNPTAVSDSPLETPTTSGVVQNTNKNCDLFLNEMGQLNLQEKGWQERLQKMKPCEELPRGVSDAHFDLLRQCQLKAWPQDFKGGNAIYFSAADISAPVMSRPEGWPSFMETSYQKSMSSLPMDENATLPEPRNQIEVQQEMCQFAMQHYQNRIAAWKMRHVPPREINSAQMLELMLDTAYEKDDYNQILPAAERLLELQKENRTAVMSVLDLMGRSLPYEKWTEDQWKIADTAYEIYVKAAEKDPAREEYQLWIKSRGMKPELLESLAKNSLTENPTSGLGYYYLAALEYGRENKSGAVNYLQQALQRETRSTRYLETLASFERNDSYPSFDFYIRPSYSLMSLESSSSNALLGAFPPTE